MSRINGSALIFDEDEVKETTGSTEFLPRLIRIMFYGLSITNDGYLERYHHYFRGITSNKTRKEFSQTAASNRKFLRDRRKLSFNMMRNVMEAMGYDIDSVSVTLRDRLTGDVKVFSTNDSIDSLKENISQEQKIGIDSL